MYLKDSEGASQALPGPRAGMVRPCLGDGTYGSSKNIRNTKEWCGNKTRIRTSR